MSEALESALAQTMEQFELLVVDDASTDATVAITEQYARRDPRVRTHVNAKNLGPARNWSRCIEMARAKWVKFLFQDDLLMPRCLEYMLHASESGVPVVASRRGAVFAPDTPEVLRNEYDKYTRQWNLATYFPKQGLIPAEALADRLVDNPTVNWIGDPNAILVSRSACQRYGTFKRNLVQLLDFEFTARLAVQKGLVYLDEELARFRVHAGSTTNRNYWGRYFKMAVLDPVVLRYEFAHGRWFEPVRGAARRRRPPVDLHSLLLRAADGARWQLHRLPRGPERDRARQDWNAVLRAYPRLAYWLYLRIARRILTR